MFLENATIELLGWNVTRYYDNLGLGKNFSSLTQNLEVIKKGTNPFLLHPNLKLLHE